MSRTQLHRVASWLTALLCLFWALGARAQVIDCAVDLWPGINMAESAHWGPLYASGAPCREDTTHRASIRSEFGVDVRIFLPANFSTSWHNEVPRDIVTWIADAVRATMRRLRPALRPMDINVILLETALQPDAAEINFDIMAIRQRVIPCGISLPIISIVDRWDEGTTAGTQPRNDFQATVAHEVFHCYQSEYVLDQLENVESRLRAWWVEGTAEFVSQSIYPCSRSSLEFAEQYAPDQNVFTQSYSAFVFFQHLAEKHRFDPPRLAAFLRSMPTSPGDRPQRAALATWPDIGAQWHAFARALRDFDIAGCVAEHLNGVFGEPQTDVHGSTVVKLTAQPFTAPAHLIRFPENAKYEVKVRDNSGSSDTGSADPDRVSYRIGAGGSGALWSRADGGSFTVDNECGEDANYMFVATSARRDQSPFQVEIEITEMPRALPPGMGCCINTRQHDQCLVGSWRLDKAYMLQQLSARLPKVSWEMPQGELRTRYRTDGRIAGARVQLTVKGVMQMRAGPAPFQISVAGQGNGRWSTGLEKGNRVLYSCPDRDEPTIEKRVEWPHGPVDTAPPDLSGQTIEGMTFPYSCSGDTLTLKLPGNVMQQIYRRVAP